MADMLTIGTLATNTFKRALDVTSHNVANVGTEGYSRQRAEIVSNSPGVVGSQFLGGGSTVSTIERIQADYIQRQLYTSSSMVERYQASYDSAKQVEGVVAGNDEGIKDFMQRYFDSLQTVASNPTSAPTKQLLLDEAGNLESHIANMSSVLEDVHQQTNEQIQDLTKEINDRLGMIHEINKQVERSFVVGSQAPNDLLDQRDQAILELSQYIDIKTFPQEDGSIEIHTANGKLPLINDNILTNIQTGSSPYPDEKRTEIYAFIAGEKRQISEYIQGGQLGGVLDFRTEMLDRAQNDLGLTLNGMVASMNWQHYQGWDSGNPAQAGGEVFAPLLANVMHNRDNNPVSDDGSALSVSFSPENLAGIAMPPYTSGQPASYADKQALYNEALSQIGDFKAREYEMKYSSDTGQFQVYERGENKVLGTFTPDGTDFAMIDGFKFMVDPAKAGSANYADNDSFIVKPHQDILKTFEVELRDPDFIATRGNSPIPDYSVIEDQGLTTNATQFNQLFANPAVGASTFALIDISPADGVIDRSEYEALIEQSIQPSPAAEGDNTNIANMASLQSKELLLDDSGGGATTTLLGSYSVMASNVGLYVRSSDIQLTAQENVYAQIMDRRESLSGVSLDEEAANILRFQQAYEASAQIISTSQSLFQTLLGVVRG